MTKMALQGGSKKIIRANAKFDMKDNRCYT